VDRRTKVELYEQIRREYEHGGGTIRGIAKKLGIHRRMVREAVLSAVPVKRKTPERERPKLEPVMTFVDAILEADKTAPRKQRHTAHRIWCRIRGEMAEVKVAESTIRRYVRERKIELNLTKRETFIPQSYAWGREAQVDCKRLTNTPVRELPITGIQNEPWRNLAFESTNAGRTRQQE
jgi:hypothetical protein